ncbi:predicted protein [Sclerotinia sclerotiorum 1980 UF-70]|uniref:Uncharacterized protein n=1 Tax=Sclerotinia sclerotiorum (strain ATCC 18683 / 1980 / Ss-1) TaxID=665079 RepID=A7EBL3_SCLS1|nr:predicted protein [Sclerotinia sclerotiorum 1980 UF-70]EDN99841.1 predicted protein [Sclerotinia sclerotiorum 1980 UF-70]
MIWNEDLCGDVRLLGWPVDPYIKKSNIDKCRLIQKDDSRGQIVFEAIQTFAISLN